MQKAIVMGASSGIGRALARVLAANGYTVGLAARRLPLLVELQEEIGPAARVKQIDVTDTAQAMIQLGAFIEELQGVDLIVLSSGFGQINPALDWGAEEQTIRVNVQGFAAMANVAMRYFIGQGRGHLVGISSVAALRGHHAAPAYGASKAFISTYLDSLRQKAFRLGLPIAVTEIRPGFVDTAMGQSPQRFWVASPEVAARQMFRDIARRRKCTYVTRRWVLVAWLMKIAPNWLYDRLG
jgi:short-subunit dehydrogenase